MAMTFPLAAVDFIDQLLVQEVTFDPAEQVEVNQTGGGEQLSAELAPQLWRGEVRLARMTGAEAAGIEALLDVLRVPGRSFYIYDTRRPYPQMDPTGAIFGAATPTIHTLPVNARDIRITGMPASYVLKRGDHLAFTYAGRRALHRVVTATVTASGAGLTPTFEVVPPIRPGATVGLAVEFLKPTCKAIIAPGSVNKGTTKKTITEGMSFKFVQTLG